MSTKNDNVIMIAVGTDCAVLSRSFSVSRSVLQDAEKQAVGTYSVVQGNALSSADSVCVALDIFGLSAVDWIRVSGAVCTLYRIVVEKIAGFAAVVRRNRVFSKRRLKTCFRRCPGRCDHRPAAKCVILACAGGLRL